MFQKSHKNYLSLKSLIIFKTVENGKIFLLMLSFLTSIILYMVSS